MNVQEDNEPYDDINVVPMLDLAFVLLVIFIIMTTATTVVGLIPLVYGIGGSDPFIAPMALALGYGLLFATPLTIAFVPCIYAVRVDIMNLGARLFRRRVVVSG